MLWRFSVGCQTLLHDFFVIFRQLGREKSAAYRFVEIDIFGAGFDLRYATTRAWEVTRSPGPRGDRYPD